MIAKSSFTVSLALHLLVLSLFALSLSPLPSYRLTGHQTYINAAAVKYSPKPVGEISPPRRNPPKTHSSLTLPKHVTKPIGGISPPRRNPPKNSPSPQSTKHNATRTSALVAYLAQQLAAHQQPPFEYDISTTSKITVGFTLAPSGEVSQLHIVQTQGDASLASSALATVTAAAPFRQAHRFITMPKHIVLPILYDNRGEL